MRASRDPVILPHLRTRTHQPSLGNALALEVADEGTLTSCEADGLRAPDAPAIPGRHA